MRGRASREIRFALSETVQSFFQRSTGHLLDKAGNDTRQEILDAVLESKHTRLPLWREQPENIVGVLHTKDIVRAVIEAAIAEAEKGKP